MAKVSMHLGFTFRVGDLSTNQYGRVDLSVDQIDTELPIEQQLEESKDAAEQIWQFIKSKVDKNIDDVLDVQGNPDEIGKPVGNDLLQGVITLPAIYLMEKYPGNNPIKSLFKDINQTKHLDKALDMIHNSNIIPECQVTAHEYYEQAIQSLNTVPQSIYRTSLEELAAYMIDRKY